MSVSTDQSSPSDTNRCDLLPQFVEGEETLPWKLQVRRGEAGSRVPVEAADLPVDPSNVSR